MEKIKLGLIGYGYWGPNFARIIDNLDDCEFKYCADLVDASLNQVKKQYPQTIVTKDYHVILNDPEVTAVVIVTPTKTHFKIAKDSLLSGKHVLLEKPLTATSEEARQLLEISKKNKLKLMVDHTFLFNPAVHHLKKIIDVGELGAIRHLHFQRRNLGPIRKDVNVLWDLAPHDLSILFYLLMQKPISAMARGASFLQKGVDDVVSATIMYEENIMANLVFSWIDPIKIRDITIVGSKKMVLFDDVKDVDKLQIFDKSAQVIEATKHASYQEHQIALHSGDITTPVIENKEPLKEVVIAFLDYVRNNKPSISDGQNGLSVVELLEALQFSLDNGSQVIDIS